MSRSSLLRVSTVFTFVDDELASIRFRLGPDGQVYRTSPRFRPNHVPVLLGNQVTSVVLFLLHQAYWVASDPARADREIEEAVEVGTGVAHAETAPVWESRDGAFVRTAAEALNRRCYNKFSRIFGAANLDHVKRSFVCSRSTAMVALNCLAFDPRGIEIHLAGSSVRDPNVIEELMEALARRRGWTIRGLFGR